MRPKERREGGEQDLFRARLDQIIDLDHALVRLAGAIDWRFLEEKLGAVYTDEPGRPPLPTRLMAGLSILKHSYNLSDEVLCERWVENPYFQCFCGEEFFQHRLVFDRSSLTRWRQRMGEQKLQALLQESLAVATRTAAMKPSDLARVVVDTTVQPKAVMFPTDAKLFNRARERLVRGHNAPADHKFRVYTAGQKRRVNQQIKREFKRRAAIEPVIGHLKDDHRMGRNYLAHSSGDAINAILAAVGYNFRRLIQWLRLLMLRILIVASFAVQLKSA